MVVTPDEIERIVAQVLAQLQPATNGRAPGVAAVNSSVAPSISKPAVTVAAAADEGIVAISEAVITGALLLDRLGTKRKVRIQPNAVLTPSARDVLRQKNIECLRGPAPAKSTGSLRTIVLVSQASAAVTSVLDQLKLTSSNWERRLTGTATETAQQAISIVCRGEAETVIAVSGEPELFACLANRHTEVRAAAIYETRQLDALKKSLNPNVLAVNSTGKSYMELRNLFRALM